MTDPYKILLPYKTINMNMSFASSYVQKYTRVRYKLISDNYGDYVIFDPTDNNSYKIGSYHLNFFPKTLYKTEHSAEQSLDDILTKNGYYLLNTQDEVDKYKLLI